MDFDRKLSRSKDEVNGDNVNEWEECAEFLLRVEHDKDLSIGVQSLNASDRVFAAGITTSYNNKAPLLVHTKGNAWNKTKPESRLIRRAGDLPNYDARLVAQQATYIYQVVFQTDYDPVLYSSQVLLCYLMASIKLSKGQRIQLSLSLSDKLDGGNKWHYDFEIKFEDALVIMSLVIYQMWKAGTAVVEEKPKDFGVRWEKFDEPVSFHNAHWRQPRINVEHTDFRRVIPPWHMKLLLEVPRDRSAEFEAGIAEKYGL